MSDQRFRNHLRGQGGFTFAELAFGLLVFVIGAVVLINHLSVNYSATRAQSDRVFAFAKAQAILAEVQAYVDRGDAAAAIDLDALDDGTTNRSALTISKEGGNLVTADHPLSGNSQRDGEWVWWRRITVQPFQSLSNRNVRYVTVRIYKKDNNGVDLQLAEISSVVHSVGSAYPTTQVYDLYLIALENVPGWWVYMEAIKPFFESTLQDLQARNPGLELRTHWITKASYGRNRWYRPYINVAADSNANVPNVYWYPGKMPTGSASANYYVPGAMKANMSYDGVATHGYDADLNPYPYALADWFNHAMRYPQEKALHDQRVAAATARRLAIEDANRNGGTPPPEMDDGSEEPTYRLLLEDMCTNPDKYRRALIVNLHGELLPMPSLRNYSDAAKDPENLPEVRVVTHPEELRTKRTATITDDVWLRVYSYVTSPDHYTGSTTMPVDRPIAVKIMNVDLTASGGGLIAGAEVRRLVGGVDVGGSSAYLPFANAPQRSAATYPNEMCYTVQFVDPGAGQEKFTLIKLYNSPVRTPYLQIPSGTGPFYGIANTTRARLYGLEYIPSCTEAGGDFSRDLSVTGDGPKNTARWRIKLPSSVYTLSRFVTITGGYYNPNADVTLKVQTLIWDDSRTTAENLQFGQVFPQPTDATLFRPDNLSETYTWWADSATDVPMTERYQFQGDPRHNPYRDNLKSTTTPDFQDGYNWFFDSLNNSGQNAAADYPALSSGNLRNLWLGRLRQDLPRFFQLFRTGLVNTGSVYTTLTGFSYYYVGFGNEIGYDSANSYPSSIPVNLRPWGSPGFTGYADNITGARWLVRSFANYWGANPWWSMPWLGELAPDASYSTRWKVDGNLSAGNGAFNFYQTTEAGCYWSSRNLTYGTSLYTSIQRTSQEGCTSFFNIGSSSSTFHHQFSSSTGTLTGSGPELAANYNFPMPTTTSITRPFMLNTNNSGGTGDEWNIAPYNSSERGTGTLLKTYYNHTSGATGSGLVQLFNNAGSSSCFVIVNGLAATVESGSSFIAKYALLSMIQSFLEGGSTTLTGAHRIKQLPRVTITSPTEITELLNPATIPIQAQTDWVRWDGLKYTTGTSTAFAESESELQYVVTYSRDGGRTWLQTEDGTLATPGSKPTNALYLHNDLGTGNETFTWTVPAASFSAGSYLIRVEVYRQNQSLHYSQHMAKIFINR